MSYEELFTEPIMPQIDLPEDPKEKETSWVFVPDDFNNRRLKDGDFPYISREALEDMRLNDPVLFSFLETVTGIQGIDDEYLYRRNIANYASKDSFLNSAGCIYGILLAKVQETGGDLPRLDGDRMEYILSGSLVMELQSCFAQTSLPEHRYSLRKIEIGPTLSELLDKIKKDKPGMYRKMIRQLSQYRAVKRDPFVKLGGMVIYGLLKSQEEVDIVNLDIGVNLEE
jgi:hypothetical protein